VHGLRDLILAGKDRQPGKLAVHLGAADPALVFLKNVQNRLV